MTDANPLLLHSCIMCEGMCFSKEHVPSFTSHTAGHKNDSFYTETVSFMYLIVNDEHYSSYVCVCLHES